ncbi:uncharacterized protein [Spinacia oleracea]|uniref:Uncharacterized protein n=1 Tax=Spinacia oleracea TaxID=3562 RepID=A0ABM3QU17_SPIOL|nr:uncharacterized protein LOC110782866 [Spinacia oleracea]
MSNVVVSLLLFLSKIRFFRLLPPCVLSRSIDLPPNSPSRTGQILSLSLEGEVNLFLMVIKGQSGSSSKRREKRVEVARNSKLKGKDPVVDEEMEEDEEGRSLSGDDSEESVFDGDAYEDVEDDEYEDEIYEDEEFEDELCQRTVKRAPKKRQSAKSRRVISYDEVEEEEDIEDEDGEYMDGGYEDEGEDVVVRVQKRGKSWKEVGQNALKKKAHLQMMRKRRREDYDDVDEGRRPVKKTILPAMKKMGRKFDETGVAKGKPPAKQKAIRGNNRRMFVRVPIPKHPMSRGEYAKFHGVVVATQRANCGRKIFYLDHLCRHPVRWDEFPRIKVWTQEEVDEAKNRDRKASEDYGRITTVDVVYGDLKEIMEGRRSPAVEVAEMVAQMTSSEWRRTLTQEVTEMWDNFQILSVSDKQLAPLLQDRRGVSRERGMRSYHATDHLTIDVDGVAMPLDQSVNKVLTELDADDDSDVELQPSDGGRVFVGPHQLTQKQASTRSTRHNSTYRFKLVTGHFQMECHRRRWDNWV